MTQIKKVKTSEGVQFYPQTHTKAVIDDNGYTAESRLQAMQDEINQAQLEVGAVSSDLAPTEGSTNWVTSGGVYNELSPIKEHLYGAKIYNGYTSGQYITQNNGTIASDEDWLLTEMMPVAEGETVRVVFGGAGEDNHSCVTFFTSAKAAFNQWTSNKYTSERTVTAPSGSAFMRCGIHTAYLETGCVYVNGKVIWNSVGKDVPSLIDTMEEKADLDYVKHNAGGFYTGVTKEIPLDTSSRIDEYIAANDKTWKSSTRTPSFFLPIKPDTLYEFTANATNPSRYALLTTNQWVHNTVASFATGETLHEVAAGTSVKFTTPSDAAYICMTIMLSNVDNMPQSLKEFMTIDTAVGNLSDEVTKNSISPITYQLTVGRIVDARTSSPTFGQAIAATNTDWGITQYIDLNGASHVKYYTPTISGSANYAGVTGTVYYNANKEPLTTGVRVIMSGTAAAQWVTDEVPDGARYMRIGTWSTLGGSSYKVTPYKLKASDIYGLDVTDDTLMLGNARYTSDGSTANTVSLLHFSDIHGDEGAARAIKEYYTKYSGLISDMLSTGDVVYYYATDGIDFYVNNGLTTSLLALGNHDGATSDGPNKQGSADWDAKGAQWDYETYYAPYISGWNVTQPTDAPTNYLMYYYKDYTSASMRLIVLDVMHQTAEQLQWLVDTLASAKTAGYTVVVASHYIPNTFVSDNIVKKADGDINSFHCLEAGSVTSIDSRFKLATTYADAVENFIAGGGKFAVWLCGHYHTDYFTYSNTHPNILFCAINQAGYRRGGGQGYRLVGDHCANVVTVAPALGMLKIVRVGLKSDKYLRPINVLTYDYVNKRVVTNY